MTEPTSASVAGLDPAGARLRDGDALLATYRAGTTFLAGPAGSLLAEGSRAVLVGRAGDGDLAARAAALLAGHPDPDGPAVLVGAVPFEPAEAAVLRVPERVHRGTPLDPAGATGAREAPIDPSAARVRALPRPEQYRRMVRDAVAAIDAGALDKVVLARSVACEFPGPLDPARVLDALARRDRTGYLFAVDLETAPGAAPSGAGPGRALVGASPELLVSRRGDRVVSNPLAGSTPRRADPAEDARAAADLLASPKDRHEHALVADAVARVLEPVCSRLDVPAEPELVTTSRLWHLSTRVTGTLADPDDPASSALALGLALHPTPAVCGAPRDAAHRAIAGLEPTARGFYSGLLGWGDEHGDGEWVVALRCGELAGNRARVHAGAGIVTGSVPADELAETRVKLATFLGALGLEESGGVAR